MEGLHSRAILAQEGAGCSLFGRTRTDDWGPVDLILDLLFLSLIVAPVVAFITRIRRWCTQDTSSKGEFSSKEVVLPSGQRVHLRNG